MSLNRLLFISLMIFLVQTVLAAYDADLVVGFDRVNYTLPWYSGYLSIPGGKQLHYVFFPSQTQKKNDPLLLWLNGGPGCSSMIGMLHQLGPFTFRRNSTQLHLNNNSWNAQANLLFLESPAGVGFSKGPTVSSDESTAEDNYQALKAFMVKFPEYTSNQLYLSGQSYAGVYVPTLAYRIDQANKGGDEINLKGFIVGNACTSFQECYQQDIHGLDLGRYQIQYMYKHNFINLQDYQRFRGRCLMGYGSKPCAEVIINLQNKFYSLNVSINNIYLPCTYQTIAFPISSNGRRLKANADGAFTTCDDEIGAFKLLNQPTIQQKMHVSMGSNFVWTPCSDDVSSKYKKNQNQSYWVYKELLNKYRIWVYSGDVDSNVPITGTKRWINQLRVELDLPTITPWREWWVKGQHVHQDQVAGDVWRLQGLTFVSVKGAGHFVPQNKGRASAVMISSFLKGSSLPFV